VFLDRDDPAMTDEKPRAPLRLTAEDQDDLAIISSAVQDAVGQLGGFEYLTQKRQFVFALNRFRWELLLKNPKAKDLVRIRSGLAVNGVLAVKAKGIPQGNKDHVMQVLALEFAPAAEAPAGTILVKFAGGADLKLDVECIDVSLFDTAQSWSTPRQPRHKGLR